MYLLIILLSSIFTLFFITLLKIETNMKQVLVFGMILVILCALYLFCNSNKTILSKEEIQIINNHLSNLKFSDNINNNNIINKFNNQISTTQIKNTQNKSNNINPNNISNIINNKKCKCEDKTSDNIIPFQNYNNRDCTNDLSCIIPPDNKNTFKPTIENIIKNNKNSIKNCKKCGDILDLTNNPISEKFQYHGCLVKENNLNKYQYDGLCIHCINN